MKNLLITAGLILCMVGFVSAQDDDDHKKKKRRTKDDMLIEIGLNNYMTDGVFPDNTNEVYTLKPFGSWNFAIGMTYLTPVAGPLYLEWGGSVNWNGFKFQDAKTRISKDVNGVIFSNDEVLGIESQKSKLSVSYLNANFIPMLKMGSRKNSVRLGAGVYGGYRLSSSAKVIYEANDYKLKDKEGDNYYINNLKYGVKARFGFKDVDLYASYDLNSLFIEGKGPDLNVVSVGITLTDLYN